MKAKSSSPSLNRRCVGISVKINKLRKESGIPTEPYVRLRLKILKALTTDRFVCPICLAVVKSLRYTRNDGGIFRFWTESVCRTCFEDMKKPLQTIGFRL